MKLAIVEGFFPDLKGQAEYTTKATGSTWPVAIGKAVKQLSRIKGVKKKHIRSIALRVSLSDTVSNELEEKL